MMPELPVDAESFLLKNGCRETSGPTDNAMGREIMVDAMYGKRLQVEGGVEGGPYSIRLPLSQLEEVRGMLDRHEISYWVDSAAISINRGPARISIHLGWNNDPVQIQSILDQAE
jgi:hypothetical protein